MQTHKQEKIGIFFGKVLTFNYMYGIIIYVGERHKQNQRNDDYANAKN